MRITFKLYANLTPYLPPSVRRGNAMELDIARESTIADVIAPFALPMNMVRLVLINGIYVEPKDRSTRILAEGDVLAIWPPIAGG